MIDAPALVTALIIGAMSGAAWAAFTYPKKFKVLAGAIAVPAGFIGSILAIYYLGYIIGRYDLLLDKLDPPPDVAEAIAAGDIEAATDKMMAWIFPLKLKWTIAILFLTTIYLAMLSLLGNYFSGKDEEQRPADKNADSDADDKADA